MILYRDTLSHFASSFHKIHSGRVIHTSCDLLKNHGSKPWRGDRHSESGSKAFVTGNGGVDTSSTLRCHRYALRVAV